MDKLSEIFESIKERLSNPLVFSFLCSWLILNWKITLGVFWLDISQINNFGYRTIFDFVSHELNWEDGFWLPLVFALLYTICMPVIRALIEVLYVWIEKWSENWKLSISKNGKVGIEKYLGLKVNYDERTKILEDVIKKESIAMDSFNNLQTKYLKLESDYNDSLASKNTLSELFLIERDVKILDGNWINKWKSSTDLKLTNSESVLIQNGNYYIIDGLSQTHVFLITHFHFDRNAGTVFFIKERLNQEQPYLNGDFKFNINVLKFSGKNMLIGRENGTTEIRYERYSATD